MVVNYNLGDNQLSSARVVMIMMTDNTQLGTKEHIQRTNYLMMTRSLRLLIITPFVPGSIEFKKLIGGRQ